MDLSGFKAVNANVPAFCHFRGPDGAPLYADDQKTPVGVWLLGQDSDELTELGNRQTDRFLKLREAGGGVSSASAVANEVEFLAKATVLSGKEWSGIVFDGDKWKLDDASAASLYREVPLFREQAARFVRDRGNWLKASPKA